MLYVKDIFINNKYSKLSSNSCFCFQLCSLLPCVSSTPPSSVHGGITCRSRFQASGRSMTASTQGGLLYTGLLGRHRKVRLGPVLITGQVRLGSPPALPVSQSHRLGTPSPFCQRFQSPCIRVWRRATHFFLLPIRFCGSLSPGWLFPWRAIG